ncbi:hypothetical protein QOZ91_001055 [Clostridium sardiniense]|nr:hypothetical protein [Clostridium sardiniense]
MEYLKALLKDSIRLLFISLDIGFTTMCLVFGNNIDIVQL